MAVDMEKMKGVLAVRVKLHRQASNEMSCLSLDEENPKHTFLPLSNWYVPPLCTKAACMDLNIRR